MVKVDEHTAAVNALLDIKLIPFALLDYIWIIFVYFTVAFFIEVLIDGYLLPPFDYENEVKIPSWKLYLQIFLQIAIQGFVAFIIYAIVQYFPYPKIFMQYYNPTSPIGFFLHSPSIIVTLIMMLSYSLKKRVFLLFSRFNKNIHLEDLINTGRLKYY
jgi:hypothetical protein